MQPHSAFPHQVAGHDLIRILDNGQLAKPSATAEIQFYETARNHNSILQFLPKYYGKTWLCAQSEDVDASSNTDGTEALVLENLIVGYTKPCVMDLKLGIRLYDDNANEEKKARMIKQASVTTSGSTGVRICGAKFWDPINLEWRVYSREHGRALTPDTLVASIRGFVLQTLIPSSQRLSIIKRLISRLTALKDTMASLATRMYSSSILIVYEGGLDSQDVDGDAKCDVRMIDFAHSSWREDEEGPDEGYLFGLSTVIDILRQISKSIEYQRIINKS